MGNNAVQDKSFSFALRMVRLFRYLSEEKGERVLSKQVLRSGTSVGANIEEGLSAISEREFIVKLQISYKEIKETIYWIRLLRAADYLDDTQAASILADAEELAALLCAILKTTKNKTTNNKKK